MAEPEDTLILSILRPYPSELSQDLQTQQLHFSVVFSRSNKGDLAV